MKIKLFNCAALFFGLMIFSSCGGKEGQLSADLLTSNMTNASSIVRYIATVGSPGSDSLFYPSNCLQCANGSDSCSSSNRCVTNNCGFSTNEPFSLDIAFSNFSAGETLQITVCSLSSSFQFIGFAQTSAVNEDGQVALLNMQDDDTDQCMPLMPPICS